MDCSFVRSASHNCVAWIEAEVTDYSLVSTSSEFDHLVTGPCVPNSYESTLWGSGGEKLAISGEFDTRESRVLTFDLNNMLILAKMNNFDMAYNFVRNGQNTGIFCCGKADDSVRVVTCDEGIWAIELLEVVHVNLIHMNDHDFVLAQLSG